MRSSSSLLKAIRLARIQHLLHKNPEGLTSRQIAELTGVCIRTIQRDLLDLQIDIGVPIIQNGDRYSILSGYDLPPIFLNLYEAMALFLASRLALRQTDENNPYMQNALYKVSDALPSPVAEQLKKGIERISTKDINQRFLQVFEAVAVSWITQRQLRIEYKSLNSTMLKEWIVNPYFVEMTGIGYSMYVIGYGVRQGKEGIITFKFDRIQSAEVLETEFTIPADFNIDDLLSSSWGVMWGEDTEIKLHFSAYVTRRVKESNWHPSQIIEDLPDGSCVMTLKVGSVLEITPWIRSWGPDVEVLAPASLRTEFKQWSTRLVQIYSQE